MGMLAVAAAAKNLPDAPRFSVLTVDHGVRPEAAAEASMVAESCAKLGLPHYVLSADRHLETADLQQKARQMRYALMARWCAEQAADALAVAHHQDDQAETVLMRLARGSGVNGLGGMRPRQLLQTEAGPLLVLRPFLGLRGGLLKRDASAAGLPSAADPSNADRRFERVRWRQDLPRLAACGLGVEALCGLADDMQAVQAALDEKLQTWMTAHARWHCYGVLLLPRDAYLDLPATLRHRLMSACVQHFGGAEHPPKRTRLARFAARPASALHGAATLGGVQMRWRQAQLFIGREAVACPRGELTRGDMIWDRRFVMQADRSGLNVAPLAASGVRALRAAGAVFDKTVPACYLAALPAFFDGQTLLACAIVRPETGFRSDCVEFKTMCRDILQGRQDW